MKAGKAKSLAGFCIGEIPLGESSSKLLRGEKMPRTKKKSPGRPAKGKSRSFFDDPNHEGADEEGLPSDEAGRLKTKKSYEELLGIRIEKLKGRVLNREKINKNIDGIYYICAECKKICHNLDEGLVEDPQRQLNLCSACAKEKGIKGTPA